ncbi:hypothetical protein GBA52_010904 [Prunus armeniaca]|nr:hypothetical protein GBA52_010904 [Prunus armeniaca]
MSCIPIFMDRVLMALGGTREERATIIRSLFNSFDAANLGYLDHPQIEAELSALQILPLYKYAKDLMKVRLSEVLKVHG